MGDCRRARVPTEMGDDTPALFSLAEYTRSVSPQEFCRQLGFNWMSALDLYSKGILSFDPREVDSLSRSQAAELRFLGKLVSAGCCGSILKALLAGLEAPYAYNLERMYFDWDRAEWRLLEDTEHIEQRFDDWLEELVSWGDTMVIERLQEKLHDAVQILLAKRSSPRDVDRTPLVRSAGEGL